jgi:hypothetical protein
MGQCRSSPDARVLEGDRLNPATENRMLLFQKIERSIQLPDDGFGLIREDDDFNIYFFVQHLDTSTFNLMPGNFADPWNKQIATSAGPF